MTTTNMEVDAPSDGAAAHKKLDVHPLALVHMSDQYTRIKCGGSVLSAQDPVVGLLFGMTNTIKDAQDIPTTASPLASQQVSLHQAVFPKHDVVGWYRVVSYSEMAVPTKQDVQTTQTLQQHHGKHDDFVFLLLQVKQDAKEQQQQDDDELPLSIYKLHESRSVLVQVPHWQLATAEPERISIERVVREEPQKEHGGDASMTLSSDYAHQLSNVQQSIHAMKERVDVLVDYLQKVQSQQVPQVDHDLLRDIQSLVAYYPLLQNDKPENDPLSHLAAVTRTVCAIQGYTDKFKALHVSRAPSARGGAGGEATSASRRYKS